MTASYRLSQPVDFAIVGSGPAGGVLARELSLAGFSVVVFEQGPRLTLGSFEHDELKHWFNAGMTNDPVKNPQTFRDDRSKRGERNLIRPSLTYARTVGGSSVHYTANYWRLHESISTSDRAGADRRHRLHRLAHHVRELEPYYTKVDWEIGVPDWRARARSTRGAASRIRCRRCP